MPCSRFANLLAERRRAAGKHLEMTLLISLHLVESLSPDGNDQIARM